MGPEGGSRLGARSEDQVTPVPGEYQRTHGRPRPVSLGVRVRLEKGRVSRKVRSSRFDAGHRGPPQSPMTPDRGPSTGKPRFTGTGTTPAPTGSSERLCQPSARTPFLRVRGTNGLPGTRWRDGFTHVSLLPLSSGPGYSPPGQERIQSLMVLYPEDT